MIKDTHRDHLYAIRSTRDDLMMPKAKLMYTHWQSIGAMLRYSSVKIYVMMYLYILLSYSTIKSYDHGTPLPPTHSMDKP